MTGTIHAFLTALAQLDARGVREVLERQPMCVRVRDPEGRGALQILWRVSAKPLDMSEGVALEAKRENEQALREHALKVEGQKIEETPFLQRLLSREAYALVDRHQTASRALSHVTAWWDHALEQGWEAEAWAGDVAFQIEMEITALAHVMEVQEFLVGAVDALLVRGASEAIFGDILALANDGDAAAEAMAQRIQAHLRARRALDQPVNTRSRSRHRA